MSERRYDIDWLRTGTMLAVFLMHCTGFFVPFDWHLKNNETSEALMPLLLWLDLWLMPMFFLLSGFSSWYSLKSRNAGQYLWERVLRLLIPFYTVGAFILLPVQYYIELTSHGRPVSDIWQIIPPYWDSYGSFRFRFDYPFLTNVWPGHLWFLTFLFIVSLVLLPLLLYLRSKSGRGVIEKLAQWSKPWGGIYLPLVPLILVRIGLRSTFSGEHSWADLTYYAVTFLMGYLMAADERFTQSIKKHSWICLIFGIAAFAGELILIMKYRYPYPGTEYFSWKYILFQVVMGIANWSWIAWFLSLGAKYLNFNNTVLSYSNAAVLPFYILHQTIILVVGWYVIPLEFSILPKYLIISICSFVCIMIIYELVIKRINPIRFLFGMRLRKKNPK